MKRMYLQRKEYTCGVISVVNALRYFDIKKVKYSDIDYYTRKVNCTEDGTDVEDLVFELTRHFNVTRSKHLDYENYQTFILYYITDRGYHVTFVYKKQNGFWCMTNHAGRNSEAKGNYHRTLNTAQLNKFINKRESELYVLSIKE